MLKKFSKVSIVFITLFYFCMDCIYAYDFVNPDNESKVNRRIEDIYEQQELYEALLDLDDGSLLLNMVSSNLFWFPIGSEESVYINGIEFATGEPESVSLGDTFGYHEWRTQFGNGSGFHSGQDINGKGGVGHLKVIAPKDGKVTYPKNDSQIMWEDHFLDIDGLRNLTDPSCGNQVTIEHSDGVVSVFCHLAKGSIRVHAGDTVRQGQVIGLVGSSGSSTGAHLHYTVRLNGELVDPLDYIDPENPRPMSINSSFSTMSTTLTRDEFISKMQNYCARTNKPGFCNDFAANAGTIYDTSVSHGVNPELVVVTAGTETGSKWSLTDECKYTNNYWGIKIYNGKPCNTGGIYDSLEEGIIAYADTIRAYNPGGDNAKKVKNTNEDRSKAGCDPAGHGVPGTLEGMQSVYSWIGDYRYDPGDWNIGGCKYFNGYVYGSNYCSTVPTCKKYGYDKSTNSIWAECSADSRTTVCEQNDYTAFQLKQKVSLRYDIFGL